MYRHFGNENGLTLIELLTAVSIVVTLAGVGIPIFLKSMANAKHSEASTNLGAIKISQEIYKVSNGNYLTCTQYPVGSPDETPVSWGSGNNEFNTIGFSTNAFVLFRYGVVATAGSGSSPSTFVAEAFADTDGDGDTVLYEVTEKTAPLVSPAGGTATIPGFTNDGTPSED